MKHFHLLAPDLAIDLGTSNTMVARMDQGIVIQEPTVVALDYKKLEIMAVGEEAKKLIGKSPESIVAVRPLQDGVISDFDLTQAMLEYYIHKAIRGISLVAPRVTICVPSGATDVENRAVQESTLQSGARDVFLVEETLASAYGMGLIKNPSQGAMVLNMGAGTTEAAVVSGYGVITAETMKTGGDDVDLMIRDYIANKYKLVIGKNSAEKLKMSIGTIRMGEQRTAMEISGRDRLSGMPKSQDIYASDIREAILPFVNQLIDRIRATLEKTPPELASDIVHRGLFLTGGGSQLDGLDELIQHEIGIKALVSKHPTTDTINGASYIMKNINSLVKRGDEHDKVQEEKK